jgi:hypothetical protein
MIDSRQKTGYSIFTSSAYRTDTAKWRFPQEIAILHDLAMSTSEVKVL